MINLGSYYKTLCTGMLWTTPEAQAQTLTLLYTIFLQSKGYPYKGLYVDNDSVFHPLKANATNPHNNILGL